MVTYPTVELAPDAIARAAATLTALRDPELFARVAGVLLLDVYPGLEQTGGPGDLGRDALVREGLWGEERVVVQYSINQRWVSKVRSELARYENDGTLPKRMLFVTASNALKRSSLLAAH